MTEKTNLIELIDNIDRWLNSLENMYYYSSVSTNLLIREWKVIKKSHLKNERNKKT